MKEHSNAARIASRSNPRIKALTRLRERQCRLETGLLLVEGSREILRALDAGVRVSEVYFCPEFFAGTNEDDIIRRAAGVGAALFRLSGQVFQKVCYRDGPDGLVAVARHVPRTLADLRLSDNPLIILAEAVEKPGNLGAIIRSADAVSADAVMVCDGVTDVTNPNVIRASTGTVFTVPVVESGAGEAVSWLKSRGIGITAATPHAKTVYTDLDFTKPLAIAVGAEHRGLSEALLNASDSPALIPMSGAADSLNVSVAATLLMFEAVRQRGSVPRRSSPRA